MTEIVKAYNTEAKRRTVEDFGGDFGFRIVWDVLDHWADVKVYEVVATDMDNTTKYFNIKDWKNSEEQTDDIDKAETYLEGYIKWDGCTELDMGCPHWCGPSSWQKHIALLEHIWRTAFELMGKPLANQWDCPIDTMDRPKRVL